jgi:hypothetical protein
VFTEVGFVLVDSLVDMVRQLSHPITVSYSGPSEL